MCSSLLATDPKFCQQDNMAAHLPPGTMGMASANANGAEPASNEAEAFWYFAIGSMMHPTSMKNRNIVPLESVPGELFDYELVFTGGMGFAEAVPCPGSSFHGVLVSSIVYTY